MRSRAGHRDGFTLVEILIVVVILGILAAIVVPQFASAADSAREGSCATTLNNLASAVEVYRARNNAWPPDTSTGTWENALDGLIREEEFEATTPIGGNWDIEINENGIVAAVGIHFGGSAPSSTAGLIEIDRILDDGDLSTGSFREIRSNGWYLVIAE